MIVSETPKSSKSRWLQACVLLCAMVVLPLGIASAQDYEAVERRLGEGVAEGELTLKQAGVMMDALKKAGGAKKDQGLDRAEAYLMKVKKELGALVEAGSISREDAAKRYEGAKKGLKARMAGRGERQRGDDKQREYEGFERRIKAAVRQGKMTREEAGEKLKGFRQRLEMAEQAERSERGITVEEYKRAEAKMQKMIEEGKAKPEDVERRLIEMRKMIRDEGERGDGRQRTTHGDKRAEYKGFERRIKAAVAEGKMTREQAREKIEGYKKRMAMAERRGNEHAEFEAYLKGVWKGLQIGVKEGKLSEEEAKAKMSEFKKQALKRAESGEHDRKGLSEHKEGKRKESEHK